MNDAAKSFDIAYINNAGLVLVHPFLPMLFKRLGLVTSGEDGARAVHLLQYLVDGRCDAPEPELLLNKLLCGLEPDSPAPPIAPSDEEIALCDQLLAAVIANWSHMRNTSITGLRATFLQREGHLEWRDGGCSLSVQRKTVDVLMDQLPWNLNVVRQPWMRQALQVHW